MFQKRRRPRKQGYGTTGRKKDLTVSCDETKHETTSPEQDHSITSPHSNGWAECETKNGSAPSRRRRMSLDIPFYRTFPISRTYQAVAIKGAARFLEYTNSSNAQSHFQ